MAFFKVLRFLLLLLVSVLLVECHAQIGSRVDPQLKKVLTETKEANIIISMKNGVQPILNSFQASSFQQLNRGTRTTLLYNALRSHTMKTQEKIISLLKAKESVQYKSFWITNKILIKNADLELVNELAGLEDIAEIFEDPKTHIENVYDPSKSRVVLKKVNFAPEWNLVQMSVPEVWAAGYNGTNVVVGIIDTGVRGTHEALRDNYKNDGKSWRDPLDMYDVPTDIYNHGTHVIGSVLGKDGIGIAPEAKWIGCKGYDDFGGGTMSSFLECGEFLVCPTDADGTNPDCTRVVDVACNSWGFNGGTNFDDMLNTWNSVGIVAVFANGNFGPMCGNLLSPADNINAIGIGASSIEASLASFSSRGPSYFNVMKPDVSAPGLDIYSADNSGDDVYSIKSGTSMACPNAAGVSALIKSKRMDIEYPEFRQLLRDSAQQNVISTGESCDSVSDTEWPNNHFGFGIVNALRAVDML